MKPLLIFLLLASISSCDGIPDIKNMRSEHAKAAVVNKLFLKRPAYNMEYSNDWKIDSTDKDFSLDSYFTFDSASDDGFVSFFIFNTPIDEKLFIDKQVEANLKKTIKNGKVGYFTEWGKYKGVGAIINGRLLGLNKAEVRAFAHSGDSCSFLVVSQLLDSDAEQDRPGLRLIESSFKLIQ